MKDSSNKNDKMNSPASSNINGIVKDIITVLLICAAIYAGTVYIGIDNIRIAIEKAGIWGPGVFMLFRILSIVIAPIGGVAFYLLAGPLFGFQKGFIYIYLSDLLAYTIVFYISRIFGRSIMNRFLFKTSSDQVDRVLGLVGNWQGFFYARIVSFSFAEIPSYVAGLTSLPYWQYMIVTIPLSALTILIFMFAGDAMTNMVVLLVTAVAVVLVVLILVIRRYLKSGGA